jgi:diaminobutyrate acetyltransferase
MIRNVCASDVSEIRKLVKACEPLTLHTAITYGVLFRSFPDTCFVVETSGQLSGFISSIRGTAHPEAIYVWQIGVIPSERGKGLSFQLIDSVAIAARRIGCSLLQVGIEPSNDQSLSVFRAYARKKGQLLTPSRIRIYSPTIIEERYPAIGS